MSQTDMSMRIAETAMLWKLGEGRPYDVVEAAVAALVEGIDGQYLSQLAGATQASAHYEVEELWSKVATELNLPDDDPQQPIGRVLAAKAYARKLLREEASPDRIPSLFYKVFGTENPAPIARIVQLEATGSPIDEVTAAVQQLLEFE